MIFSSTIFLFGFLPCILMVYYLLPLRAKNIFLLIGSLVFYAWGELGYTLLMLISIIWNYCFGRMLGTGTGPKRWLLVFAIAGNLAILGYFKYANFLIDNINILLKAVDLSTVQADPVHLPLGISFFTFQAISYIVDVYRGQTGSQKNILTLGLYIAMFPQLIAGPIVRYSSVARQLVARTVALDQMEQGVIRFVFGLAKKLLIANPLGELADTILALPQDQLPAQLAWVAIIAYTLQIYFDFSGYSDMAIGLGMLFGFTFPENFNYPYIATTVREFWRRWHMSLTGWLRDYLYIPMGGSRVGSRRTMVNLITVFLLCGLWHGASWNFIIWGGWHGMFIVLERGSFGDIMKKAPRLFNHLYLLLVVIIGWVFFRAENMSHAFSLFSSMVGLNGWQATRYPLQLYMSGEALAALCIAVVLSMPIYKYVKGKMQHGLSGFCWRLGTIMILLYASFMKISSGTYNPFLYFRF